MVYSWLAKYLILYAILSIVTMISFFYQFKYVNSKTTFRGLLRSYNFTDLKYILLWSNKCNPVKFMCEGQKTFITGRCSFTNCYVTTNRQLIGDVADFDVILFHGRELPTDISLLPQSRLPHQKYVFVSMESSARFPVYNNIFKNSYFNWTLTYKLDSDEYIGYIIIKDKKGRVIGPKKEMHWKKVEAMTPINDTLKAKLSTKKFAAAWFVSNCNALSGRKAIAKKLQTELAKHNMQVDIYGNCGTKFCPRSRMKTCLQNLETDYFFYLSFENSLADDYVTEKLLHALKHYTVPVVYGGANYTRFMPDGVYLSVQKSRIRELAMEMVDIIKDKQKYYEFFKWHNHYSYADLDESSDTDRYCKLCALVNNQEEFSRTSVYEDFSQWWNPH